MTLDHLHTFSLLILTAPCVIRLVTLQQIKVNEVLIEDLDIPKGLCDYARTNFVENLVVGAPSRNAFAR